MGMYQDFGDIYLDFARGGQTAAKAQDYVRDLNLETAVAGVAYGIDGVRYSREYFNSYPDNVLAMKLDASEAGNLTFDASLAMSTVPKTENKSITAEGDVITLKGQLTDNQLQYEAQLKVLHSGGTIRANEDGTISVDGADEVTLILACGTDYKNEYPAYRGQNPHAAVSQRIETAASKGYDKLREDHVADYQELFSRVSFDLAAEIPQIPTDQLIAEYRSGKYDRALEVMAYQMGRYLTIAGSREGTLPANLNGVWMIGDAGQFWNADYHFNVNYQMNYWPAMASNLAECMLSHNEFMEGLREPGRVSAGASAGVPSAEGEENGFLVHLATNIFGQSAPFAAPYCGWNPAGSSWALQNTYDYYRYTGDEEYLRETIYPMLREMAVFWSKYLWHSPYQDRLVVSPSVSAEQGPVTNGTTYDQSLVWQLFEEAIEASEILGVDEEQRAVWKDLQSQLDPLMIGEEGQIKEWYEETTIGKAQAGDLEEIAIPNMNLGDQSAVHRHTSHLVGLYPGTLISEETPEYLKAAEYSLSHKGFESTGWAKANRLNLWARTKNKDKTYQMLQGLLKSNYAGVMNNLLTSHGSGQDYKGSPIFQIEANYGLTSGINEMLVQSQLGYVDLLPTLPREWETGRIDGIVARGNFVLGMKWSNGTADRFEVNARAGGTFTGRYDGIADARVTDAAGNPVQVTRLTDDKISFETVQGGVYRIVLPGLQEKYESALLGANRLSDQLDAPRLATAKQGLDQAIKQAEKVGEEALESEMIGQLDTLYQACALAELAFDLETTAVEAEKALETILNPDTICPEEVRSDLSGQLNETIGDCAALLADRTATRAQLTGMRERACEAAALPEQLAELLTVSFSQAGGPVADGAQITLRNPYEAENYDIRFTLNGEQPTAQSTLYQGPVPIPVGKAVLKAALFSGDRRCGNVKSVCYLSGNLAPSAVEVTDSGSLSSSLSGSKAVDGKLNTMWMLLSSATSGTLDLRFDAPITVDSAYLYASVTRAIRSFNIEYWDGEKWQSAISGATTENDTVNRKQEATVSFEPVTSDQFRLNLTDCDHPSIFEFQLFEEVSVDLAPSSKEILNRVIAYAQNAKESGEYAKAIESVRRSFDAALTAAQAADANPYAQQNEVDAAWIALMGEIHKLGFISGDKTALELVVDGAVGLNTDDYEDGDAKENFVAALTAAQAVLADGDAMQEEVDKAERDLTDAVGGLVKRDRTQLVSLETRASELEGGLDRYVETGKQEFLNALAEARGVLGDQKSSQAQINRASDRLLQTMLALRLKADKSVLEAAVLECESMDLSGFTPQSVKLFQTALSEARGLVEDQGVSTEQQALVDGAVNRLSQAEQGLIPIGEQNARQAAPAATQPSRTGDTPSIPATLTVAALAFTFTVLAGTKKKKR